MEVESTGDERLARPRCFFETGGRMTGFNVRADPV
jgi:hypothetical protein